MMNTLETSKLRSDFSVGSLPERKGGVTIGDGHPNFERKVDVSSTVDTSKPGFGAALVHEAAHAVQHARHHSDHPREKPADHKAWQQQLGSPFSEIEPYLIQIICCQKCPVLCR